MREMVIIAALLVRARLGIFVHRKVFLLGNHPDGGKFHIVFEGTRSRCDLNNAFLQPRTRHALR